MPAPITNLHNTKVGRLTVIELSGRSPRGAVLWLCKCDCGTTLEVTSSALKSQSVKSCGCLRQEVSSAVKDKRGQRFGRLIVLDVSHRTGEKGYTEWLCLCDCGREKWINTGNLHPKGVKSCGCLLAGRPESKDPKTKSLLDITGEVYGKLTAIKLHHREGYVSFWECRCECGSTLVTRITSLRNGNTQSCGCLAKHLAREKRLASLTGQIFGSLTVVGEGPVQVPRKNKSGHYLKWECLCTCGNVTYVNTSVLRAGLTKSCGCLKHKTKGAKSAQQLLLNVIHTYVTGAFRRNLEWLIAEERALELLLSNCHYCGVPPAKEYTKATSNTGKVYYNGIDRVDNALGYTEENTVACCNMCNLAKKNLTVEEFLSWVSQVYQHSVVQEKGTS
jgi:hypothetical protein